ncbi:class I SAM-dependent methyltransferase [Streptomyces spectabilis]|uniref:Ubiquinone/menaquinone biosynthesis C-methylase UbiE n=1 Tax=Streptomyces spectabilis TaxID=68270 RepID=A0A7W8EZ16_STRST|nr:class I SAM-dependent methyltransferase [Streptomyces spectabilis]MBB5108958.1 ubiquinone/menaquinone biosynthesis C-methylase UbiE [Streptomyces spectabilis]
MLPSQQELERFLLMAPSPRGLRVADFGCGTGKWTRQLAQWGAARVTGYDYSPEALSQARLQEHRAVTYEPYDVNGDSIPTSLSPGSLDLATCRFSLAYFDVARFLTDVARWLTPDGALYILTPVADEQPGAARTVDEDPYRRALPQTQLDSLLGNIQWARQNCLRDRSTAAVVLQGPHG